MDNFDDDDFGDDDHDDDGEGIHSPPRLHFEPGNAETIELGTLPDGSPLIRIGDCHGIALDFDMPLPSIPEAAIGWVRTQRGHHVLFAPTEEGRRALDAVGDADPGHREASIACGSWDLRVFDKDSLRPRCLRRHGPARVEGTLEAAAFAAIAAVWTQAGGLVD